MERLSRWDEVWKENLSKVEDPFFATSEVRRILQNRGRIRDLNGLTDLLRSCSLYISQDLTEHEINTVLRPVESGEWMLLKRQPFKPIDPERCRYAKICESRSRDQYFGSYDFHSGGPGKWKIVDIKSNKLASAAAFAANFLVSRGDEGRMFFSAGKDYANTTRTVTQEWVPLESYERDFAPSSVIQRYGLVRRTTQIYVEADDHWDVSGTSWHWRPVIANEAYELKE